MMPETVREKTVVPEELDQWFGRDRQREYVNLLMGRVGLTRRRAECFIRLWAYLVFKQTLEQHPQKPLQPVSNLATPEDTVSCTCREASTLFYPEGDRGSERSAGMMLDKLAALGLIRKSFDGNTLAIAINPLPELDTSLGEAEAVALKADAFDPRCDVIPVATLLAHNYNWMNRNVEVVPYRISQILRTWADQYGTGMRVIRRCDNLNPIGFYVFYPTTTESEILFFGPPNNGLHLSATSDTDPFQIATPGDSQCRAVFIRSWELQGRYRQQGLPLMLEDAQQTLHAMQQDFPNICDLHTLIIHPGYEALIQQLGFQRMGIDSTSSMYWVYLAIDRFLSTDIQALCEA